MIAGLKVQGYRRGRRRAPELRPTAGPATEGVTGAGTYQALWGHAWGAALDRARGLVMLRDVAGTWTETSPLTPFPNLDPKGVRHVAIAYDGSARPVVAWEEAGQVYLRQWDPSVSAVVSRGPFPGCDPVLINDVAAHRQPAHADVLLAYLGPTRSQLLARVEVEVYATAHELAIVPTGSHLDQAVADGPSVLWLGCNAQGQPWRLRSSLYPYLATETAGLTALALDGAYEVVVIHRHQVDTADLTALALDGAYEPVVIYTSHAEEAGLTALALDGAYEPVVIFSSQLEEAGLTALALDGDYTLVLVGGSAKEATATLTALALDGAYEPA